MEGVPAEKKRQKSLDLQHLPSILEIETNEARTQ